MIFDKYGLPRDTGATDSMDSCRLAGVMATFNIGTMQQFPILLYYTVGFQGCRHPHEFPANNPLNFTRDQLIPFAAGLTKVRNGHLLATLLYDDAQQRGWRAQNTERDVPGSTKTFPDGADILSPSNMLVLARAAGVNSWFLEAVGRPWMVLDIVYNAVFTPTREPNQLLCSLMVMGPRWMKFYKLVTPKWRQALRDYWSGWRGEGDLAEELISKIDAI